MPRVEVGFEGVEEKVRYRPRAERPSAWAVMNQGRLISGSMFGSS